MRATRGWTEVFVEDLATGVVTLVSTDASGVRANGGAIHPTFSPDGTKRAFVSDANNLVPGDTSNMADVFVKDLTTGAIELVGTGAGVGTGSYPPPSGVQFSPDGSHLACLSWEELVLVDLATGERTLASPQYPSPHFSTSREPVFSPDGTKSAFWSSSGLLIKDWVTGNFGVVPFGTHDGFNLQGKLSWSGDSLAIAGFNGALLVPLSFVSVAPLDAVKPEGDSVYTDFTFTVTRSGVLSQQQSVLWTVADPYAYLRPPLPDPYGEIARYFGGTLPSGTVDFAPGEISKTIVVKVPGDNDVEGYEAFVVTLSNAGEGLVIDGGSAAGQILNDDMRIHDDAYFVSPGQTLHVPAATWGALPPLYEQPVLTGGGTVFLDVNSYSSLLAGGVLANDQPLTSLGTGSVANATTTVLGLVGAVTVHTTPSPPLWTASLVEGPAHGTLTLGADGHFDYTPDPGFD